jgi:hypothetical protein
MKCFNKKGLSNLISMILLVSFAIVLGMIIIGWSSRLIERNIEKNEVRIGTDLDCMNVDVDVFDSSGTVFIKNNNLKEKKLSGFISRFDTETKIYVDYKNANDEIEAFGAKQLETNTIKDRNGVVDPGDDDSKYEEEDLISIEVIPQVSLENGEVVDCVKQSATYVF